MDPTIKMMIQGYIDGLDGMNTTNPALKQDVEAFKKELTAFAETQNDPMTFFPKFQDSGLMGKYMDLTAKLTMAAQAPAAETKAEEKPQQKHSATPSEWLEPFRTAYDYIKNLPIRERGLAVYRRLFEIGDRHTDITEFLVEVEKENLLWKLCSEDTLGILAITLTGMDPLYKGVTYATLKNIEAWEASVCEADAYYLQDLLSEDIARNAPRLIQREHYVACLGKHLMLYRGPNGKEGIMEMIATGNIVESEFKGKANNMTMAKLQARRTMEIIRKAIGLTFDDIMADEYLRYKLIATSNVCGLSRAYVQSNPVILDILADTYRNEIVPDISLVDAFRRESTLHFGRWRMPESPEHQKAAALARAVYADLPYFKYEDQLQGGSVHVGTGEGFDIKLPSSAGLG
ncbi:MAG: hypothetical protein K6A64_03400 [Bacteroidales bacterium]|nr:hypothetical protein [Bacteroidales bacterium]